MKRLIIFSALFLPAPASLQAYDNIQFNQDLLAPSTSQNLVPAGVVTDRAGHIWVTDSQNNCILTYSSAGVFLQQIGRSGSEAGQFLQPHGVASDMEGLIYV